MSENLSPEIREATIVTGFNEKVYVNDPFFRAENPVPLDWEAVAEQCYDIRPGFSTIPVRMASEEDGWLTVVRKDESENQEDI
jgi:hypothetical protein